MMFRSIFTRLNHLVVGLGFALPLAAAPGDPDPQAIRLAIDDLAASHGAGYPRAAEFLARLDALAARLGAGDTAAGAELAALRREALLANPLLDFDRWLVLVRRFPDPAAARKAMGGALGIG
jgi:hypothetical protein